MIQYNSLNLKLSNSQLNKLKSAIKNETEVVLRLSSNMIDYCFGQTTMSDNWGVCCDQIPPILADSIPNIRSKYVR